MIEDRRYKCNYLYCDTLTIITVTAMEKKNPIKVGKFIYYSTKY